MPKISIFIALSVIIRLYYFVAISPGVTKTYEATDSEEAYLKQINHLSPVPAKLELTTGAQVMLAKNVDVSQGLVNGARGVVVGFEKGDSGTF